MCYKAFIVFYLIQIVIFDKVPIIQFPSIFIRLTMVLCSQTSIHKLQWKAGFYWGPFILTRNKREARHESLVVEMRFSPGKYPKLGFTREYSWIYATSIYSDRFNVTSCVMFLQIICIYLTQTECGGLCYLHVQSVKWNRNTST